MISTYGSGMLSEVTFLATSLQLADRNLENPSGFLHFRQPAATVKMLLTCPCGSRYADLVAEAEVSLRSTLSLSKRWGPPQSPTLRLAAPVPLVECAESDPKTPLP